MLLYICEWWVAMSLGFFDQIGFEHVVRIFFLGILYLMIIQGDQNSVSAWSKTRSILFARTLFARPPPRRRCRDALFDQRVIVVFAIGICRSLSSFHFEQTFSLCCRRSRLLNWCESQIRVTIRRRSYVLSVQIIENCKLLVLIIEVVFLFRPSFRFRISRSLKVNKLINEHVKYLLKN